MPPGGATLPAHLLGHYPDRSLQPPHHALASSRSSRSGSSWNDRGGSFWSQHWSSGVATPGRRRILVFPVLLMLRSAGIPALCTTGTCNSDPLQPTGYRLLRHYDDHYPPPRGAGLHLNFPYPERRTRAQPGFRWSNGYSGSPTTSASSHDRRAVRRRVRLVRDSLHGPLPASLFDFIEGVFRWHNSASRPTPLLLITDRYPPFSLQP